MSRKVLIVDYGMGNLHSLISTLDFLGQETTLSDQKEDLLNSTHIILPGVGSFRKAMEIIKKKKLDSFLNEAIQNPNIKILGICLGMQLLGFSSEEDGGAEGLKLVENKITKFESKSENFIKIPHVGFNKIKVSQEVKGTIFEGLRENSFFYFTHSYKMERSPEPGIYSLCHYGEKFISAFQLDNMCGTQFHPELSQSDGIRVLMNFLKL